MLCGSGILLEKSLYNFLSRPLRKTSHWPMSCERDFFTLKLRVNSLPLATIYEVKIPLRKWKKSLLQRNPAQMTWAIKCDRTRQHAALLYTRAWLLAPTSKKVPTFLKSKKVSKHIQYVPSSSSHLTQLISIGSKTPQCYIACISKQRATVSILLYYGLFPSTLAQY
jgi:hypothetical protein